MKNAIYTTPTGVQLPCDVLGGPYPDGQVYVAFKGQGSQGNVPADRVQYIEDKDAPRQGLEVK
jgi:hypothetical protein